MNDVREHVLWLLRGGHAHVGFEQAVADLPMQLQGRSAAGQPHTPWRLLEHMRLAQSDILEFSRNPAHVSPEFPDGYWPKQDAPPNADAWGISVAAFQKDANDFQALVTDTDQDLLYSFPWGDGQTLLREALLVADHNAYHLGQLIALRRALGAWSE